MTREEEIKTRLDEAEHIEYQKWGFEYACEGSLEAFGDAEADIRYLLARNEELQRRVEKMEAVVEAAKFDRKELHHPECKCHFCAAVDALDAVDAPEPSPELVPVYPGPDLKRGDFVYIPDGRRAEVYNPFLDHGTLTNLGTFCASVLRREKMAADAEEE